MTTCGGIGSICSIDAVQLVKYCGVALMSSVLLIGSGTMTTSLHQFLERSHLVGGPLDRQRVGDERLQGVGHVSGRLVAQPVDLALAGRDVGVFQPGDDRLDHLQVVAGCRRR